MSALEKVQSPSFVLFKRSDDDVVKARPFGGDHKQIVANALNETLEKHSETIIELSKV